MSEFGWKAERKAFAFGLALSLLIIVTMNTLYFFGLVG
jgi:hypothetical protein